MVLSNELISLLFDYARSSINAGFKGERFIPSGVPLALKVKCGVFVTLTIGGDLRGCIGFVKPLPLWDGVVKASFSAAFEDYRFSPLSAGEFSKVLIEVSVLSSPVPVTLEGIKSGDGVIVFKGVNNALFLPQVWDELPVKDDFINNLLRKAGISSVKGVKFSKFSVDSWKEVRPLVFTRSS